MKKNKLKTIIIGIFLLILITIGSFFLFSHGNNDNLLKFDESAKTYKSKIKKPEEWSKDKIAFPAFKEIKVVEGTDKLYIALENPSFNEAYLQFTLYLDNSKSDFYQSGLVKPGQAITEVPLNPNLKPGTHNIELAMRAYAPNDNKTSLNGTNVNFKLQVLEKGD